ncbi:MAG: zinc metalloprotease HtpX [Candidatus Babeliales bacterium]|jgi:heat shock protein HtpX
MIFNQIKTALLLGTLSGLFFLLGYWLGGNNGLVIAFIISILMNFGAYFFADKIVLRMYDAHPLDRTRYANIYEMVEELCYQARLPMPKLWYIPTNMANAFATGRNPQHASVAVTQGILDILDEHELRGVLAHELSHVRNRDILISTIAATIATAIGYIAHMMQWAVMFGGMRSDRDGERSSGLGALLVAIFMPIIATLLQLAVSRSREYLADETGAKMCHDPLALASALEKLHANAAVRHVQPESTAQVSTASLFIVNPFTLEGLMTLLSTHPPVRKRIERLRAMAR